MSTATATTTADPPPPGAFDIPLPPPAAASGLSTPLSLRDLPDNDTGNALRLARLNEGQILFNHTAQTWLIWDGTRWRRDDDGEIKRRAFEVGAFLLKEVDQIKDEDTKKGMGKLAIQAGNATKIRAMVELAAALPEIATTAEKLDRNPWLLGCPNGTIDLHTGALLTPDPAHRITRQAGAPYHPTAQCPRWERFVMEIFKEEQPVADFFQRWCGYCLTGDVSEEKFLFAYGVGANGKSTAIKALAAVLGDYALSSPSSLFCTSPRGKDRERANPEVASLAGVRLAYASEPGEGEHFDEEKLKMLTGGEIVNARFLNQNPITFTPTAKLV